MSRKLSFTLKLKLLDKVKERYPTRAKELFPELDGEVPISWILSEEEINELLEEIAEESLGR